MFRWRSARASRAVSIKTEIHRCYAVSKDANLSAPVVVLGGVLALEWSVTLLYESNILQIHISQVVMNPEAYPWWRLISAYYVANWLAMAALVLPLCAGTIGMLLHAHWAGAILRVCTVVGLGTVTVGSLAHFSLWIVWGPWHLSERLMIEAALSLGAIMIQVVLLWFVTIRAPSV